MDIEETLTKWYKAKKEMDSLDKTINEYKLKIMKEMNNREVEKISAGQFSVSRRRNTKKTVSKESLPETIWNQYASVCHYDSYHLIKK